ncbi:4-alpha-glucanotransferase [Streptomyces sodiiphilus]|uniref:4-alpha-glucanotransferase n=1 Tax=Streptomyces sodiiphilus TaxID=226217 RepID=A0ABN2NTZ9_9ACTN
MGGLSQLAAAHGVATSYRPAPGRCVEVEPDTVVAVLSALGVDASTPRAVSDALERHRESRDAAGLLPPTVVWPLAPAPGLPEGTVLRVRTEDGRELDWDPAARPPPLPPGRHVLDARAPGGRTGRATLVVAPERVPAPRHRSHGLLLQLYSLLSARSWGMGDLADLAELAGWAGHTLGTGFLQLNPLHAAVPGAPGEATDPSPYRPGSRRFPDPVHLRVEDVPEYAYLGPAARQRVEPLLRRAAALRHAVLHRGAAIDRDAVWDLKRQALEQMRNVVPGPGRRARFCAYLAEQGQALEDHATWCALAELHGPDWRTWPAPLRDPRSSGTARARADHLERVDFHCWLAWLTDEQLAGAQRAAREAGMAVGLVHDLAVGVHPHGSDSWAQQRVLATGMSAGAPPDAFNAKGQDWGLPPWRPDALAAAGYEPFAGLVSGLLRHSGALRIDHVMSLFRLWWIPEGAEPRAGTYVRYDSRALLGVLALEAHRAGAAVVGEDLGTVEPGVREELAARGVLGTSVLWFERDRPQPAAAGEGRDGDATPPDGMDDGPDGVREIAGPLRPQEWRAGCLATVTTHDLPPTAARLSGADVELRGRLGLLPGAPEAERVAARAEVDRWLALFLRLGLLPRWSTPQQQITAAYRFLARTPATMVGIWLPDAVGDTRPQNVPGTCREYPNWRLPLADGGGRPVALEELAADGRLARLVDAVSRDMRPGRGAVRDVG